MEKAGDTEGIETGETCGLKQGKQAQSKQTSITYEQTALPLDYLT
jgi:hypothetical protein